MKDLTARRSSSSEGWQPATRLELLVESRAVNHTAETPKRGVAVSPSTSGSPWQPKTERRQPTR